MSDDTTSIIKDPVTVADAVQDSNIKNVSIRAYIVMVLVLTVCIMSAISKEVTEPLYSLAVLSVGFYFGQKKQ